MSRMRWVGPSATQPKRTPAALTLSIASMAISGLVRAACRSAGTFALAKRAGSPVRLSGRNRCAGHLAIAVEAVRRIDALFDIERAILGKPAAERQAARRELSLPLVTDLGTWLRGRRAAMARHNPASAACDYLLKDWPAFTAFLDDGRICLTNNEAERALRGVALGRKSWQFAGSDRGGDRAAFMYSLIVTAKLNGIDPQAWLADVFARIADMPQTRPGEMLPWNWQPTGTTPALAQAA